MCAHQFFSLEIVPQKTDTWAYAKTWDQGCCRRVLVGVFHRYSSVCSLSELILLGRLLSFVGE